MASITIDIKAETTVDTITIELPHYTTDGYTHYAIMAPNLAISCNDWFRSQQAHIWVYNNVPREAMGSKMTQVTREEFYKVYDAAQLRIQNALL
jgi:hypothetical protein